MGKNLIPKNVANPTLYKSIRNKMRLEHKKKGKRWGAYSSGQLVQEYIRRGGRYIGPHPNKSRKSKNHSGKLARWYREKWIDACQYIKGKIKPCGRKNVRSGKFPYCRPLHRITKQTPRTVKELSKSQIKRLCSRKRRNPKEIVKHKSRRKRSPRSRRKRSRRSRRKRSPRSRRMK